MDDKIKKLRIREIDVRIANLKQNIGSMENKIKELSDRKNELITENIVFNKLQSLGLITKYSNFIKH
jgi:two-component sensor histidine kinase